MCPQMFIVFSFPQSNLWQDMNLFYLYLVFLYRWQFSGWGALTWTFQFDLHFHSRISANLANWKTRGLTKPDNKIINHRGNGIIQSTGLHVSPTHCTWTCLLSTMPPMQLMQHFCWGNTCILFTLGNRCTCCYATHTTYAAFLLGYHPVYFRKQEYILLCQLYNLGSMSKESSCRYTIYCSSPRIVLALINAQSLICH